MNKVSKRAWIVVAGCLAILVGVALFLFRYMHNAEAWVSFPGSPHLYDGINPSIGMVEDRSGTVLLDATSDRRYAADPQVRQATMHLLGDRDGFIESPLLGHYTQDMISYSPVMGLEIEEHTPATVHLTVSASAQKAALAALNGRKGAVGVYNYLTGDILCAVTSPTYDPDSVPDLASAPEGVYDGVYVNRFFRSSYTPGSVFKTVTAAAALSSIENIEEMTFYCEGETIIDGERIVCSGAHGVQDLASALRNSCNVAFGEITVLLGAERITACTEQIGICGSLSFDGIHTAAGHFDVSSAGDGSLAWAGIGQYTDLINPCSFMTYMGMLANGGEAAMPRVVGSITSGETVTYEPTVQLLESGLEEAVTSRMAELMRDNVVNGYGTALFPDVAVCAKSGTAETSGEKENTALFAGFVQDERYPLAFIVVVEEGGYGTAAAAPIAGEVLSVCIEELDLQNSSK